MSVIFTAVHLQEMKYIGLLLLGESLNSVLPCSKYEINAIQA